ncbi:MAG: putative ATP-binding cassette protein nasD [Chlamydiales bacterium]|jgi:ABC-type nitrate/sulfonate/bicarbonate transport system ATPase subunit|nr:putative ATP-binding cassette protein nasD [Chlamydiales bacterium]
MLELQQISFAYNTCKILNSLELIVRKGEIIALLGASGSGKTTLFRLIMGLESLQQGSILIEGQPLITRDCISYMIQQDLLLPWLSVLENALLGVKLQKAKFNQSMKHKINEACYLLEEVGLGAAISLYPYQLSQGMKQRVALVRTLLTEQSILLLDEPFGGLDVAIRQKIYQLLLKLYAQRQQTIIFITHDFHDALYLSHRICLLSKGKIFQEWSAVNDMKDDPIKYFTLQREISNLMMETE